MAKSVSGVIFYDETLRQRPAAACRSPVPQQLGVLPGIKVDTGAKRWPAFPTRPSPKGSTACANG